MSRFSKAGVAGDSDLKKQLKIKTGTLKRCVDSSYRASSSDLLSSNAQSLLTYTFLSHVQPLGRAQNVRDREAAGRGQAREVDCRRVGRARSQEGSALILFLRTHRHVLVTNRSYCKCAIRATGESLDDFVRMLSYIDFIHMSSCIIVPRHCFLERRGPVTATSQEEMVQESVQVLATTRTNVIAAHDAMNAFLVRYRPSVALFVALVYSLFLYFFLGSFSIHAFHILLEFHFRRGNVNSF
jgi:hypothetical protein